VENVLLLVLEQELKIVRSTVQTILTLNANIVAQSQCGFAGVQLIFAILVTM
jgi:hypothetical protein